MYVVASNPLAALGHAYPPPHHLTISTVLLLFDPVHPATYDLLSNSPLFQFSVGPLETLQPFLAAHCM